MSSPDRPNGSSGDGGPSAAEDEKREPAPLEKSPRGRLIVRSSSHPPREIEGEGAGRDVSGARPLPRSEPAPADNEEGRAKRSTPAERPRRRKQIALERTLRDTLPARPQSLRSSRAPDAPIGERSISEEDWDEQARLMVISAGAESEHATEAAGSALTPPPPAGAAAVASVPHAVGIDPQAEPPAAARPRIFLRVALVLLAALVLWAILRR